jgi:hypothetical protein
MRPLRPGVLVALELLGFAAKVAGEGLRGRHGDVATRFGGRLVYVLCEGSV